MPVATSCAVARDPSQLVSRIFSTMNSVSSSNSLEEDDSLGLDWDELEASGCVDRLLGSAGLFPAGEYLESDGLWPDGD